MDNYQLILLLEYRLYLAHLKWQELIGKYSHLIHL